MGLDLEDLLSSAFGRVVVVAVFLLSAIWVGSMIGQFAWLVTDLRHLVADIDELWASPVWLINLWIIPNAAFLAAAAVYLMVSENTGYAWWGIVVGVESLFVMLGQTFGFHTPDDAPWAWVAWIFLLGSVEIGIWLVFAMRRNRWVRELEILKMENARHRAELAAGGGPDISDEEED
jgi:hypothetical protein